MKRKIELLAPGGDIDSIKAAILAGADAIYCGLDRFNARNRATNISFENLQGILRLAHNNNCEVFLTLNIILVDSEIPAIIRLLNKLENTSIDGIIIQDLGLFYVLSNYFKSLNIHASTQLTTHNEGQIKFLKKLNVCRVNLSRELNIHEIKALTVTASENNIFTEVFVHGSYCISFSGLCYMSSVHSGNSGNRGRCSQPCRDQYIKTDAGKDFPLNMKDNSAWFDLKELYEAGVSSLKIEGRIKKFDYVYTIVKSWRKQLHSLYKNNSLSNDNSDLYKVFNRNFSNSFLKGDLIKEMFIDNPRDFSVQHLSEVKTYDSANEFERDKHQFFEEKEKFKKSIKNNIDQLSIEKAPLIINISGEIGTPIKLTVTAPDTSFVIFSERNLVSKGTEPLNRETLLKRLKAINETEYYIQDLDLSKLQPDLYIPFKELSTIKKRILFALNNSKEIIPPIQLPAIQKHGSAKIKPKLSVLISSQEDLNLLKSFDAEIYFQLPDNFSNYSSELFELFTKNQTLIPWFPSVLIGDDYSAAVEFLVQIHPKKIVTNNTGIAHAAYEIGIPWIAGPFLNIVNSYSLLTLKENFNCVGAFISNEINKIQISNIKKPKDFKLYYSIFHPIILMTSRQCLFHQVTGCEKNKIENTCIQNCEKSASITNLKGITSIIEKSKGNYHRVFNETHYLNPDIVKDITNTFSSFLIDLSNVKTDTKIDVEKSELIYHFENLINGNHASKKELEQMIHPTINIQYKKGI